MVVGQYTDINGDHGFLFNGSTYTPLDDPSATAGHTYAQGVSGSTIVGRYNASGTTYGFLYDLGSQTYTTLIDPLGTNGTDPKGVAGSSVVGLYYDSNYPVNGTHGFLYDLGSQSYTTLDDPLAIAGQTFARGVSGNTIVGSYSDANGSHGFLYNVNTQAYTTLNDPSAILTDGGTTAFGLSGSTVVGYYDDANGTHGFLYDLGSQSYTTLDDPSATAGHTYAEAISGNTVVGYYDDANGAHGFEVTVPEPALLGIFCFGTVVVLARSRRKH